MDEFQYRAMRANFPFPWREHVYQDRRLGGVVQVLAANGREVPLFTITKFLTHVTTRLAQANAAGAPVNPPSPGAPA